MDAASAEARLARAVRAARDDLRARYPVLVDDTAWSWDGAPVVSGSVLVAAQALTYQRAVGAAFDLAPVDVPRPGVLTDPDVDFRAVAWGQLTGVGAVDLFAKADGADLQTQWPADAHVRHFHDASARSLVQLPDLTVGWVDADRVEATTVDADPWTALQRMPAGELGAGGPLSGVASVARRRLGRPYLWGGNTEDAADCSGYVQAVLLEATGWLLPKNTRDQMKRGVRVAVSGIAAGDLVFVRGRDKGLMHVGVALPTDDGVSVIHSCLSRNVVLEETLPAFLERYRFTAARRVLEWT